MISIAIRYTRGLGNNKVREQIVRYKGVLGPDGRCLEAVNRGGRLRVETIASGMLLRCRENELIFVKNIFFSCSA